MDTDKNTQELVTRIGDGVGHALDKIILFLARLSAGMIMFMMWLAIGEKAERITELESALATSRAVVAAQDVILSRAVVTDPGTDGQPGRNDE